MNYATSSMDISGLPSISWYTNSIRLSVYWYLYSVKLDSENLTTFIEHQILSKLLLTEL